MEKSWYYIFQFAVLMRCLATNLGTDESALLSLLTSDPRNILSTNWTNSTPVCSWIGVTCGLRHHRVSSLDISNMGLSGTIPPHLGNLSFLVSLNLAHNSFTGTLPPQLSLLRRLKSFSARDNNFQGQIPPWLAHMPNLYYLSLTNNTFSGAIPSSIFNISTLRGIFLSMNELSGALPTNYTCPNLQEISLSYNHLTGDFPSTLFECRQLRVVSLSGNAFSAEIPAAFGKLTSLQLLYLGANFLYGIIPKEMGNLENLVELAIEENGISGALPVSISNMSSLQRLNLEGNKLSGEISRDIGNLTMLKYLYISENDLTGVIPLEIGEVYQLEQLELFFNSLSGSIPAEIFNISSLVYLQLGGNNLSGTLPTNLCTVSSSLKWISVAHNSISGAIPNSISNCLHLNTLDLISNKFTSFVPHSLANLTLLNFLGLSKNNLRIEPSSSELSFITSLTRCTCLRSLNIGDNPLHGTIPSSIGNFSSTLQTFSAPNCKIKGIIPDEIGYLSNLTELDLGGNELSSVIPPTLRHLLSLQKIDLHSNNLVGPIPEGLCDVDSWYVIDLSQNKLWGAIPECLGNVTSLRGLHLHSNKLNSSIPSSLWGLKDLLKLDLSSNSLTGFLPPEMGNLVAANYINLSMNNLSKSIPNTIGNLQSLVNLSLAHNRFEGCIPLSVGSMISLVTLDLPCNNLSGSIPKSLEKLQQLEYFNVSFNSLSGEIPSGGHFRNFSVESFKGNDALCGTLKFHGFSICRTASRQKSTWKKLELSLFIVAGVIAFVALAFIYARCKRKDKTINGIVELPSVAPQRISYYDILQATEQFNETNLLGTGSYGSVYMGILRDGNVIAVKVFKQHPEASFNSFDVECEVLRNVRHRNLTKVLSTCSNEKVKALVLEYMPNANLEKWLYSHNNFLDVRQRLDIMIDVAFALEYLHHGYSSPIVHCDLKPSNVLLDADMVAHVCDFGIAKLLGDEQSTMLTNTLATLGYIAPEYGFEGLVSTRCDVYSYGVMLMETFTRKRPSDDMFAGDLTLKSWVERLIPQSPDRVVDPNLFMNLEDKRANNILQCVSSILLLALKCSTEFPAERINIKEALVELQKIKRLFSNNT